MTIPTYSINAGTTIHGVIAVWDNAPVQPLDSGQINYSDWKPHIWRVAKMLVDSYLELRAARGAALTTIETNDYDYPNEAQIYDTVILETLTGQHVGHLMIDVIANFRIDHTSRTLGAFSNGFDHGFKT